MSTRNVKDWSEVGTFVWYFFAHIMGAWAISTCFHVPFFSALAAALYIKFLINDIKA